MLKESLKKSIIKTVTLEKPAWVRACVGYASYWAIESLYLCNPRHLRLRRFLAASQWWPLEALERYQREKLKTILQYAYLYVPYYTELFKKLKLRFDVLGERETFRSIPVLTKELIAKNQDKLLSQKVPRRCLESFETSGSTGTPTKLYFDKRCRYVWHEFWLRAHRAMGINNSHRNLWIWPTPFINADRGLRYIYHPHLNRIWVSPFEAGNDFWEWRIRLIKTFRPRSIRASPALLYELACYARERGITDIAADCFVSYFDNLLEYQKERIEEQFKRKIYNYYGCQERSISAFQCSEQKGLHLDMERGLTEVADENQSPLQEGCKGRIIATGFHNFAMPLIRYDTKDVGSVTSACCPCGRKMIQINTFDGRSSSVVKCNNAIIYPSLLASLMQRFKTIQECQFVWENAGQVVVNFIPRNGFSPSLREEVIRYLRGIIGEEARIELRAVAAIPRTKLGKFPFVVVKSA